MKKTILLFCLILIFQAVQAEVIDYAKDGFPPLRPPVNNYTKITQAERTILGKTYEKQHIGTRLNRLERNVFNKTFPRLSYEQRMNNIIVNYKNNLPKDISFRGLEKLEKRVFNRTYANDLPENRISRLEEQVLGTIQSGDLDNRYSVLSKAVPKYGKWSYTTPSYCGPARSNSGWRGLASSFGGFFNNTFTGYPTGMSPQIYSPYINNYGPDYQRGYYTNQGWQYQNSAFGSGTGVHILD